MEHPSLDKITLVTSKFSSIILELIMLCRLSCKNELKWSGQLLVHRAMQKMVRQQYGLNVTTDKVYDLMFELDPEGLQACGRVGYRKELNGEETWA